MRRRISVRYLKDGRVVLAKWPRRRGPPKSETTRDQVAIWDMTLELVKASISAELDIALAATGGTAFYAKDILIMSAYGNYVSFPGWGKFPNG